MKPIRRTLIIVQSLVLVVLAKRQMWRFFFSFFIVELVLRARYQCFVLAEKLSREQASS